MRTVVILGMMVWKSESSTLPFNYHEDWPIRCKEHFHLFFFPNNTFLPCCDKSSMFIANTTTTTPTRLLLPLYLPFL